MPRESMTYSDFCRIVTRPSRVSRQRIKVEEFRCPHCDCVVPDGLEHGQPGACPDCELKMTRWGNAIEVEAPPLSADETRAKAFDDTARALARAVLAAEPGEQSAARALADKVMEMCS